MLNSPEKMRSELLLRTSSPCMGQNTQTQLLLVTCPAGLSSRIEEENKIRTIFLPHLPVLDGALPLGNLVNVLKTPFPLINQPGHVLHGI